MLEVVDVVVLPATEAEQWCDRWREEYLPGARQRGMTLVSVTRAHGDGGSCILRVTWRLPDPYAFYAMRGAAKIDPGVADFWAKTDARAVFRDRHASVLEGAS